MSEREKILVLRTFKHGEADLVVHGLNPLGARMGFFARGAMKSRKRFAGGVLEPTHYIEVSYNPAAASEAEPLHSLLEASLLRGFPGLRADYARLEAALHMLKVVHKLGQQGVVDSPELFNLLGNALQAAEFSRNLSKLKLQFELKLLSAQGVLPADPAFAPWLKLGLAAHEEIDCEPRELHLVAHESHLHLRQYLGAEI